MFGFSGELLLILGASAVLFKPKDIPIIVRTAGLLVGKAVVNLRLFQQQIGFIVQQSEASKVHKELMETMAQVQAIRHEIRSVSIINPAPFTRVLDGPENVQNSGTPDKPFLCAIRRVAAKPDGENKPTTAVPQDPGRTTSAAGLHSQAITYTRLAKALNSKSDSSETPDNELKPDLTVLPVSADTVGLLPKRSGEVKGSDIVLEAILQEQVAHQFKDFISQPGNQPPA